MNFVVPGLGTWLIGRRPVVGVLTMAGAGALLRCEELRIAPAVTGALDPHWAVDAFREAKAAQGN